MTVAAVDIVNAALRKIGSRAITAIDDTTPGGAVAGDVLSFERDSELRFHTWNFAKTRVRLPKLSIVPSSQFDFAFGLPSDWLRTIAVWDNDSGAGQADYKQEAVLTASLLTNGGFDSDTIWTKGTDWTIGSGVASKATGSATDLSETVTFVSGGLYRVSFLIAGMSAGTLTPKFTGGSTVTGTARSADGYYAEELTATAAHTAFVLSASSTFNGTVDDVEVVRLDGASAPAILSSAAALWLQYVRQVTDPNQWNPDFRQVVILRMAKVFATAVANSAGLLQTIDAELRQTLSMAKSTNGIETMPDAFPDGSWSNVRGGTDDRFGWASSRW